jgi:hypothetical protein
LLARWLWRRAHQLAAPDFLGAVFSRDGHVLAGGDSGKVNVWNLSSRRALIELSAEPNPLGFGLDGQELMTASVSTSLTFGQIRDLAKMRVLHRSAG